MGGGGGAGPEKKKYTRTGKINLKKFIYAY